MRLSRLILCGLAVLSAAQLGNAGPLRNLFGRGRGAGCQPTAPVRYAPAPRWVPATPAAPVVVQTSYSGVGVPADATPYPPIRVGVPLPTTCTNCGGR
jgi:hypothetical protein